MAQSYGKGAMSRALGAAFLNHQVEQLEKSVEGNWRERAAKIKSSDFRSGNGRAGDDGFDNTRPRRGNRGSKKGGHEKNRDRQTKRSNGRASAEEDIPLPPDETRIVVIDVSLLIHSLPLVKRWATSKDKEAFVLVIPLEALNTLDMLKKGSSALAQRARGASRMLEEQVGVNLRVRVQQDNAFVTWDALIHTLASIGTGNASANVDMSTNEVPVPREPHTLPKHADAHFNSEMTVFEDEVTELDDAPEWVRRTICCVGYEAQEASAGASDSDRVDSTAALWPKSVLLATTPVPADAPMGDDVVGDVTRSSTGVHVRRDTGTLTSYWARRVGMDVFEVPVSPGGPGVSPHPRGGHKPEAYSHSRQGRHIDGSESPVVRQYGRRRSSETRYSDEFAHRSFDGRANGPAPGAASIVPRPAYIDGDRDPPSPVSAYGEKATADKDRATSPGIILKYEHSLMSADDPPVLSKGERGSVRATMKLAPIGSELQRGLVGTKAGRAPERHRGAFAFKERGDRARERPKPSLVERPTPTTNRVVRVLARGEKLEP
ncbi:hypothetical protein FISHEDRAFT_78707 [Fistulina hepatica ATCC 64428]|uniref:PIN domain-containing protein n=1 Tax=Fistulina hepatica ATCC 64428 TaxID=1128425 RepID=A0A0D7A1B2_9AGAR|nr:hypothetical protein FISHEDRAFT_78707 [Fistulina hepatica ATCC 64428]